MTLDEKPCEEPIGIDLETATPIQNLDGPYIVVFDDPNIDKEVALHDILENDSPYPEDQSNIDETDIPISLQSSSRASRSPLESSLSNVGCRVGFPGDLFYQWYWVRRYNLALRVTPAAVVRPTTAAEVAAIVKCAVQHNVKVQAKSGGHSYANFSLGGDSGAVAIDMVNFQQFSMDDQNWQATIGAGMRLGKIDELLASNGGRAFPHGMCPSVGLGGHATIGGLGPSSRMWGTCLDHVVEVEVVTADGSIVRANSNQNQDLFFALRGAGAGFGVITEFVMRTHPAPGKVVQYTYHFSFGTSAQKARIYQTWQNIVADPDLDNRFGTAFVLHAGGAVITGDFYGTREEWHESGIPERLSQLGNGTIVVNDWLGSLAHDAQNAALHLSKMRSHFYSKSLGLRPQDLLSPSAISDIFDYVDSVEKGTTLWFIIFDATGGAVSDVPGDATAFAHRDKILFYQSYVTDTKLTDAMTGFLTGFHDKLLSLLSPAEYGTYPGYVDLSIANPQQQYWMSNLPALSQIKSKWDPNDVFHNPQSVRPAGN